MRKSDIHSTEIPGLRSFSLNSQEFYDAVCERVERPWIPNGALPREPRKWELEVIVEVGKRGRGRKGP
jgi:hypothetical protein